MSKCTQYLIILRMSRILVSGSVAYDRIMDYAGNFTDSFMPNKLHTLSVSFQVESIKEEFGGCAGNIAYNLSLLGEQPSMIARVGSDFGKYEAHLLDRGINGGTLIRDASDLTSVAHIVTDIANNQIAAFAMAAGGKPYGQLPDTAGYSCAILGAGQVVDTIALAAHCKDNDIPYYVDPGQAIPAFTFDALRIVITGCAGLFCNDYELELITKKTGWTQLQLLEQTPLVVVTRGAQGAWIMTKDGVIEIAAVPVAHVTDPTGAGDAHRAGFIKGILAGFSQKQCGQLASIVAAYAVEKHGTQNHHFTISQLKEQYKKAYGETLAL